MQTSGTYSLLMKLKFTIPFLCEKEVNNKHNNAKSGTHNLLMKLKFTIPLLNEKEVNNKQNNAKKWNSQAVGEF